MYACSDPEGMPAISPGSRSAPGVAHRHRSTDPEGVAAPSCCERFGIKYAILPPHQFQTAEPHEHDHADHGYESKLDQSNHEGVVKVVGNMA